MPTSVTETAAKIVQTPEHKAASEASKAGFSAVVKDGNMIITCPVIERLSSTGKTVIVANGAKQIVVGDNVVKVSCNAYYYV